jgi:membrane-associated phospholipid phosphatase
MDLARIHRPPTRWRFRPAVLAAALVALAVPFAILDAYALPFHQALRSGVRGLGWIRDLENPLREFGGAVDIGVALILVAVLDPARRRRILSAGAALALAFLVVHGTKIAVGRARPETGKGVLCFRGPGGGAFDDDYSSFPSSHTAAAFTVAAVLAATYPRGRWVFFALAAGCGLARVAEGRHFPTDCYAGALVGIASARLGIALEDRWWARPATGS